MRKITILEHEIDFYLKDLDGNEKKEPLFSDDLTAEHILSKILDGSTNGDLIESVLIDGEPLECTGMWWIHEIRVYVLEDKSGKEDVWSDDNFIDRAEEKGTVYSLSGFQEAFNNGEISYSNFIRIL